MILVLFVSCVVFARNSLRGQPVLQQRLVYLPVLVGLGSDVRLARRPSLTSQLWLYAVLLSTLPRAVVLDRSQWTSSISGIAFGLPVATALNLVWLLGIGRDVV